jgi:hypothetical protein
MKIYYMSDLHFEINRNAAITVAQERINVTVPPFIVGTPGDALIVDGDTIPAIFLQARRTDKQSLQMQGYFAKFVDQVKDFDFVIFTMGNHEAYHGYVNLSATFFRTYMYDVLKLDPKKYIVLDNDVYQVNDKTLIVGSTLWTDMRRDNPEAHNIVGGGMNDFRLCKLDMLEGWDDEKQENYFTTRHAYAKHHTAKDFIAKVCEDNLDKRIIVVTHHAPSYQSNGREHRGSNIIDGYCSDMEDFILAHPNITDWVHGHTHVNVEYKIGETRVTSNMRGYVDIDLSAALFNEKQFMEKFIEV